MSFGDIPWIEKMNGPKKIYIFSPTKNTDSMEGVDFMAKTASLRLTERHSNRVEKMSCMHFG